MKISQAQIKNLRKYALDGQANSYAPYSGFHVGSAILTKNGNTYSGCNVENASYGATVCAERTATWKAISSGDSSKITAIYVVVDAKEAWSPCGLCRQVLIEFAHPEAIVICEGKSKKTKTYQLADLLPDSFGPAALQKKKTSVD